MPHEPKRHLAGSGEISGRFAPDQKFEPKNVALGFAPRETHTAQLTGTVELHNEEFDQLPEWPAGLPEPEVNFGFEDARAETYVVVGGQMKTFWTDPEEGTVDDSFHGDNPYGGADPWEDLDDEDREAAIEWGRAVHERIDASTYGVMIEGSHSPAVKDIILAQATGKPSGAAAPPAAPDLTDENVRRTYAQAAEERVYRAQLELQQVYLIGAAVELRDKHPEIASFELSSDGGDPRMEAAWDADGNQIVEEKLHEANHDVWRHRNPDDFEMLMMSDPIYVEEAIAFRPGN